MRPHDQPYDETGEAPGYCQDHQSGESSEETAADQTEDGAQEHTVAEPIGYAEEETIAPEEQCPEHRRRNASDQPRQPGTWNRSKCRPHRRTEETSGDSEEADGLEKARRVCGWSVGAKNLLEFSQFGTTFKLTRPVMEPVGVVGDQLEVWVFLLDLDVSEGDIDLLITNTACAKQPVIDIEPFGLRIG